jgi:pimeloyl-ACP methyl ester carboxylesterase
MCMTILISFVRVVLVLYVLSLILLGVFESKLIFFPPTQIPSATPAMAGLAFEDLHIPVDRKTQLHAWWIPAKIPTSNTLVYFHGNAMLLEHEADVEASLFHQTGANLLLVEFRGYGSSSPLMTNGATTAEDARASLRYLQDQRHIPLKNIFICGRSIGTGVAAQLAFETPGTAGLILISPITSTNDVANASNIFRYLFRPVQWFVHTNDFNTKAKVASIHMPILLITGTLDTLAPPWMAALLYERSNEPKTLKLIEGAEHNGILEFRGDVVLRVMQTFMAANPDR